MVMQYIVHNLIYAVVWQRINERIAGGKRKVGNKGCGCLGPERVCGIGEGW